METRSSHLRNVPFRVDVNSTSIWVPQVRVFGPGRSRTLEALSSHLRNVPFRVDVNSTSVWVPQVRVFGPGRPRTLEGVHHILRPTDHRILSPMARGLVRYQHTGDFYFLTFSCFHRSQHLRTATARNIVLDSLERMRTRYEVVVAGYVVMPEHVHLLLGEPRRGTVADVLHALKLSVAQRREERPFWQARYYDFNVHNEKKRIEKLRYMHRNPVVRGLVAQRGDWRWSSFNHYATGEVGIVEIESHWTAFRRGNQLPHTLQFKPAPSP